MYGTCQRNQYKSNGVAQSVEHSPVKREVKGANPFTVPNSPILLFMSNRNFIQTLIWAFLLIALSSGLFVGCPRYNVWQSEMSGKAEFAKAEQNRRIKIEEAKANLEAEKLNAQAEVERAKGAAQAIQIENGSITPTYIQYLWVRQQSNLNDKTVIYVPTEGGLPILEAGRLGESTTPIKDGSKAKE